MPKLREHDHLVNLIPRELAQRFEELVATFHTLAEMPGAQPWDPVTLDAACIDRDVGSGCRAAARFVLYLYNPTTAWQVGRFELADFSRMDEPQRAAVALWLIGGCAWTCAGGIG